MDQLVVNSVSKRFGSQTVLADFNLTVAKGEFIALLGPSGCGKSTLLRIVAGLERPDSGRIVVAGRDVTALPPERRNLALMFQSYALLPHMSVSENVRFPLRMRASEDRATQDRKVREALALVQLEPFAARYPRQLSGGQQQRVALARSIVAEPDILLLDEPLSNLDARLRDDMQVELKRLHERLGLTTIFVTHDQNEALALADRVVLMNRGVIEQQGSPEAVYGRPRTVFAADFIGGANILELDVTRPGEAWLAAFPDGTQVPLAAHEGLAPGRRHFMLRKEAIGFLQGDAPAGSAADGYVSLPAMLETRNYLGSQVRSVLRAGGLQLIAMTDAALPAPGPGEATIRWRAEDLLPLSDA